ncbi:PREDICTED: histone chaperone ASF1A-like [Priapulus caudatus]|uniref:Histone chaperone ASF1A-like n=1 Tax=Priapulus caudatus TaxID=37621 RepID=A0ABM1DXH5_PRICU|nr:PREDICTED: histone chaperone ASF1A-like [Priapulus caudatus]
MAKVQVTNVVVLDNPSPFLNPFQFEITFECIENLPEDLEWKIIYVGSAESEEYDQVLDSVLVGPVPEGKHMFVFQADPPNPNLIPLADVVGVTVVLITCSYRGAEFVRVGYYVNNEYSDPELRENPPSQPEFDKLARNILASDPRVTRFKVDWGDESGNEENVQPAVSMDANSNQPMAMETSSNHTADDAMAGIDAMKRVHGPAATPATGL